MRVLGALLLLFALAACEDEAYRLGPGEGLDASTPADTGVDAGEADAGVMSDAGPAGQCAAPGRFSVGASGFAEDPFEGVLAEVDDTAELTFVNPQGPGQVVLRGELPVHLLGDGIYFARLETFRPFWEEARISLWHVGASGAPIDLVFVGFSGPSFASGEVEGVRYGPGAPECSIPDTSCGDAQGLGLEVFARGEALTAGYGQGAVGTGFEIFNGASSRYVLEPTCEDAPPAWGEGWIALDGTRSLACEDMARDDCVASPRCVLWGSEELDPGYACRSALTECERRTGVQACLQGPACSWDPGACYCPEGALCACAGGPAPKCRDTCSAFGGVACPGVRFCDLQDLEAPAICTPAPASLGVCDWTPGTCEGSPGGEVCACGVNGAEDFMNDCLRRQAGASGVVQGRCP